MKSQLKKFAALFLSICVALSIMTFGAFAADTQIVFNFGANGATGHVDGNDIGTSKSYTQDGYTLALTNVSKCYDGGKDETGVSAFKMGTSSVVGTFTFTAPSDVTSVIFKIAKYKAKDTTVTINGTSHVINTSSNDGAYTAITVDTTSTKSITVATVSGKTRCMIDSITYVIAGSGTPDGDEDDDDDQQGGTTTTPTEPANGTTLTIAEAIALGQTKESNSFTTNKYFVEGKITEVYNTTFGNMKITDDAGNILTIYGTYTYEGGEKVRYDAMTVKPVAGDTVKLEGVIGQYNGNSQMKDGVVVALQQAPAGDEDDDDDQGGATTPALVVIETPEAGKAYKFAMNQTNVGKILYANGEMSGYYMATVEDAAAASDVYIEATNGGFYIYTNVAGAKKYLNMVVSGTYVNAVYSDAPECVFTMDATIKAPVTSINNSTYAFGTYNTYVTIGTADIVAHPDNFFGQFYAEAANEEDEENKDDTSSDVDKEEDKEDEKEEGKVEAPETGDTAPIALALTVMLLAAAAFVASKKRV